MHESKSLTVVQPGHCMHWDSYQHVQYMRTCKVKQILMFDMAWLYGSAYLIVSRLQYTRYPLLTSEPVCRQHRTLTSHRHTLHTPKAFFPKHAKLTHGLPIFLGMLLIVKHQTS